MDADVATHTLGTSPLSEKQTGLKPRPVGRQDQKANEPKPSVGKSRIKRPALHPLGPFCRRYKVLTTVCRASYKMIATLYVLQRELRLQ
jgi:hypothetical protein